MRTTIVGALAASAAIAGCGGDGGGGLTLEQFGEQSPAVTCSVLRECYGEELLELFAGNCEAQFGAVFEEQNLPRIRAAIEAGTVEYDGSTAQACLDAIAASGCAAVDRAAVPECEAVIQGTVAPGGACSIEEECAGDAFCDTAAMTCGGTCQAQVGSGSACETDQACVAGLRCFGGTCRAPAGDGAPCQGEDGIECAGGLICVGAMDATPGECLSVAEARTETLGSSCDVQNGPFCEPGLSCALTGVEGTTPVFECVDASASGGTCNLGFPDPCPSGEYCDAMPFMAGGSFEGTCQQLPVEGEPCVQSRCAAGHTCDAESTCRETQHLGGACAGPGQCYSNACEGGVCVEPTLCE